MTTNQDKLKERYLETLINLFSHILFEINYKLSVDDKNYQTSTSKIVNISDKLKEINNISDKIKEKKLNNITNINDKIKELNKFITENDEKNFFNEIMN